MLRLALALVCSAMIATTACDNLARGQEPASLVVTNHNERIVDQTMPMMVDMHGSPLKPGDKVRLYGVIGSIDERGYVVVNLDTSDGKHFYKVEAHAHCTEKDCGDKQCTAGGQTRQVGCGEDTPEEAAQATAAGCVTCSKAGGCTACAEAHGACGLQKGQPVRNCGRACGAAVRRVGQACANACGAVRENCHSRREQRQSRRAERGGLFGCWHCG